MVSDAGMPGISDPGGAVARAAAQAGEPFTVAPGASFQLESGDAVVILGRTEDINRLQDL